MRHHRLVPAAIALLVAGSILACTCSGTSGLGRRISSLINGTPTWTPSPTPPPTFTPVPTATPTLTPTATPTQTPTPPPTDTPVSTATPAPTDTPEPEPVEEEAPPPEPPPPAEEPKPAEAPAPAAPAVGAHGVQGVLTLRDKSEFAVGEDVWFKFTATNKSGKTLLWSILGVKASTGQFQSSWSGDFSMNDGDVKDWEDKMNIGQAGQHTLVLSMCFSPLSVCQSPDGDWEDVSPPVTVTVK